MLLNIPDIGAIKSRNVVFLAVDKGMMVKIPNDRNRVATFLSEMSVSEKSYPISSQTLSR
jgi:hypothetical protein